MRGYWAIHRRDGAVLVLLSSSLALGYNVVHSLMIKHTSAVATTVIGEAKIVGLLLLSYFVLGAPAAVPCGKLGALQRRARLACPCLGHQHLFAGASWRLSASPARHAFTVAAVAARGPKRRRACMQEPPLPTLNSCGAAR